MTFAEALRAVRPMVESGEEVYICWALGAVYRDKGGEELRRYQRKIERQLGMCSSYEHWLQDNHPEFYLDLPRTEHGKSWRDCRVGRLQWIDDMIAKEEAQ